MSFVPTQVRPAEAESVELDEFSAAAEAAESLTKTEATASLCALADAPQSATVTAQSEIDPSAPVQYSTRRERREAERAIEAQARVEAFAESLRAAKDMQIASSADSDVNTLEVEIPESFRSQWKSSRTRGSRLLSGRRASGSTVALGIMAGTVVLGTGSAAAFAAVASPEAAEPTANLAEAAASATDVAPEAATQEATAAAETAMAPAPAPAIEATSVTAFDAATVAGLAGEEEVVEVATESADASGSAVTASAAQAGVVAPVGDSTISSYYGPRDSPTAGASSWHEGVDYTPGYGAPVGSMAAGTVTNVSYGGTGYGLYIEVEHTINGQSVKTVYGHLSSINVSAGQSVGAGENIGNVGNSGISTGAHLHFEVHVNGSTVDPVAYLQSN
ncbi:M23 family metallopeptidase [Gulosibacter molinativorax]|uniref:M23 family peptidase n=1 Tax=Gulosibacter molinativorax TaxID=256821 RepID=A0ABT7CAL9_9MICO|nr:M23 family metallopeptidase [Gulosibacter molinativorax]MDJ1372247.1 M23 family peptidase [Gulosibacter molinativorax]QUY63469.1 Peptidase, M23 family [Gulosibacter molinativorax]